MSAAGKSNPLAISGLVVLTLIWSYSWIFMKQFTSYIGAFDFTALRCIFGDLVLFIVLLLRGRGMRPTPFKYTLAIALLQTCGMVGLAQWALVSGGAVTLHFRRSRFIHRPFITWSRNAPDTV